MKKYINKYKKINTKISLKKANKKERIPKTKQYQNMPKEDKQRHEK